MGVHFDGTITLGSLITAVTFLAAAGAAWADVRWRIRNLEDWKASHIEESKKRDDLIRKLDLANERLGTLIQRRT